MHAYIKVLGSKVYMSRVAISRTTLKKACRSFLESKVAACCRFAISSILGCRHFPVGGVGAAGGAANWLGVDGEAVVVAMLDVEDRTGD